MRKLILLLFILPAIGCADGLPTTPYIYVQGSASATVAPDMLTIDFEIGRAHV